MLSQVDGILFQGGGVSLSFEYEFASTAKYIVESVIELSDKKMKNIAIWGTCLGFELLNQIIEGNFDLEYFKATYELDNTENIDIDSLKKSKLYSKFTKNDFINISNKKVLNENHFRGISQEFYNYSKYIKLFFKVLTKNTDDENKEYIESIEAFDYNIFGTQSHPEKTTYDTKLKDAAASSISSISISRIFSTTFIEKASLSIINKNIKEENIFEYLRFKKIEENLSNLFNIKSKYNSFELRQINPRKKLPIPYKSGTLYFIYSKINNNI